MHRCLLCVTFALLYTYASGNDVAVVVTVDCSAHDNCPTTKVCIGGKCEDPCDGLCGDNATCTVRNHIPACACKDGYTGNAFSGCVKRDMPECLTDDECGKDKVCANQRCVYPGRPQIVWNVTNYVNMCSCAPGCSKGCSTDGNSSCSFNDNCPTTKACMQGKCEDPCDGLCGDNTTCTVRNHIPACACKDGYTGNAFSGCVETGTSPAIPDRKKSFYLETSKTTDWHGAVMECLRNNSRLVSVEGMEELRDIKDLIGLTGINNGRFWTSGSDYGYEGHYIWTSTGKQLTSTSGLWLSSQADNWQDDEHCVELTDKFKEQGYGLNDTPCNKTIHYICEYSSQTKDSKVIIGNSRKNV